MANDDNAAPTHRLGECLETFAPMMGNVVAGFVIAGMMLVAGLAAIAFPLRAAHLAGWELPAGAEKGWSWFAVGGFCALGVGVTVGAAAVARYSKGLLSRRVEIWTGGFRYSSRATLEDVCWSEIVQIQETILYERPPILKGPAKLLLPKFASRSYLVVSASGKEFHLDGNSVRDIGRFGELLRDRAHRLALRWETVERRA